MIRQQSLQRRTSVGVVPAPQPSQQNDDAMVMSAVGSTGAGGGGGGGAEGITV